MSRFHIETFKPATGTEFLNQSTPASSAIRFPLARAFQPCSGGEAPLRALHH